MVAFEPAKSISQISFLELLAGRACHVCLSVEWEIDVMFLDCMKAFDQVNHNKLLIKLKGTLGDVNLVWWVEDFLANRQHFVSIDGNMSAFCVVRSGVPQGSMLGPVLFLLYINDLIVKISVKARLFADTCIVYIVVKYVNGDQSIMNR